MSLRPLFARIAIVTGTAAVSLSPIASALDLDGHVSVFLHYLERDKNHEIKHDTTGDTVQDSLVTTEITFELSQQIKFHKEGDGESFLLVPGGKRTISGSCFARGDEQGSSPGFKGIPTVSEYHGTVTGQFVPEDNAVNAETTSRGLVVNLNPSFTLKREGRGEIRSFAIKGTVDNPQDYQEITPYAGGILLPDVGSRFTLTAQLIPTIPPQSADEDPSITMNRLMTADPAVYFTGDIWTGAVTTRKRNSVSVVLHGYKEDPIAKQQTEESKTQDKKVSRTHTKQLDATVVFYLGNPTPAEMVIEPANNKDYEDWAPIPAPDTPEIEKLYAKAKPVAFHAFFKSKDAKKPAPAGTIDFYLRDISEHQGRCGNEPLKLDGVSETELRFAREQPGGVQVDPADPRHAMVSAEVTEATVNVEATDAGAYGKIVAVSESLGLRAFSKDTNEEWMDVPLDKNKNHIADGWEKAQQILGKNYPASWDDEPEPKGDTNGDGLTLYEEYRGLVINAVVSPATSIKPAQYQRKWQRLEVGRKKLFVFPHEDDDKNIYIEGANLFSRFSDVRVLFIADQFSDLQDVSDQVSQPEYMKLTPRWVNFNSKPDNPALFEQRQFAIVIKPLVANAMIRTTPHLINGVYARTKELAGVSENDLFAPERIDAVYVLKDRVMADLAKLAKELPNPLPAGKTEYNASWRDAAKKIETERGIKIDLSTVAASIDTHKGPLVHHVLAFTIAHELGHTIGMDHHHIDDFNAWSKGDGKTASGDALGEKKAEFFSKGDVRCPMRYWATDDQGDLSLLWATGNWNPAALSPTAPAMKPWHFCNEDHCMPHTRLHLKK